MNCKTFIKNLPAFVENTMMYDMKDAMEKHLDSCEECKQAYEAEIRLDEMFFSALKTEDTKFNSARSEIMKAIDKNRYGKGPLKKMKYGLRRFQWQLVSSAAVLAIAITAFPFISGPGSTGNTHLDDVAQFRIQDAAPLQERAINDTSDTAMTKKEGASMMGIAAANQPEASTTSIETNEIYQPIFQKVDIDKVAEPDFGTAWKKSPDGTLEVSINGKGAKAAEEGIANLIFSRKKDSALWRLSLTDNDTKQFTPMSVEWYDNERLLVVVGLGYGTVTAGGDLIVLDVNSGKAVNLYPVNSNDTKQQVVSAVRTDNTIEVALRIYEDDTMNNFKEEKRSLTIEEDKEGNILITNETPIPAK